MRIFIALLLATSLVGCGSPYANVIQGEWVDAEANPPEVKMSFSSDGTGTYLDTVWRADQPTRFRWRLDDEELCSTIVEPFETEEFCQILERDDQGRLRIGGGHWLRHLSR